MSAVLLQLGVDRMTVAERIALAQEILDTVAAEQARPVLSEAKKRELDRRLAEHAANPNDIVPWEQVEAAALARFGK
jgi:putative addiction module component (TIGR02574 family)